MGTSLGGWIAAELAVRNQTSLATLTLVAAAGLHVKGVPKGDIFMWSASELARNLFYDQKYSEWMLLVAPSEEEQDMQLKNRLTTARLGWQPRLYDPHLAKWLHRITFPRSLSGEQTTNWSLLPMLPRLAKEFPAHVSRFLRTAAIFRR